MMQRFDNQRPAVAFRGAALTLAACLVACSGGSSGNSSGNGNNSGGSGTSSGGANTDGGSASDQDGGSGATADTTDAQTDNIPPEAASSVGNTPGSCPNPTLQIDFSPMYSSYIPGSTAHTFQVPAVTDDGNAATWTVSDSTQIQLVPEAFGTLPGVMITIEGVGTGTTGQVSIYATESDGECGVSVLSITSSTEDDWQIGNARYNDGVSLTLMRSPDAGPPASGIRTTDGGSFYERAGGTACTNCHGATATTGPYRNVSHTPEQTGGFSDDQLVGIITQGEIPDGGYFDPTVVISNCDGGATCTQAAYNTWHSFHQWVDITSDQYPGIIVYLRSLQPEQQNGSAANFGDVGRNRPDGGARGMRPDGGTRNVFDASAP